MTQSKLYKYLGRNGNIVTPILLEKIDPIPMVKLVADSGKVLTNGKEVTKIKTLFLDELEEWHEIDDPSVKNK